jgi:hypothetical protein
MVRRFVVVCALTASLSLAGCSTATVHHSLHISGVVSCGYHLDRTYKDLRHGHRGYGAYQGYRSARSCHSVASRAANRVTNKLAKRALTTKAKH